MQYKTSMREFEPYGSVYEQPINQKMNHMISRVNRLTPNRQINQLLHFDCEVYLEMKEGIAALIIGFTPDTSKLKTFSIHRKVRIKPGMYFAIVSVSSAAACRLITSSGFSMQTVELDTPYSFNRILPNVQIREILGYYYNVRNAGYEFKGEKHDYYELTFVDRGSLETTIENNAYVINEKELMIYGPGQFHTQRISEGQSCSYVTVVFSMDNLTPNISDAENNLLLNKVFTYDKKGQAKTFTTVDGQPILKTNSATNIDLTSMTVGGGVLVAGDFPILEYGICYSTTQNPDTTTNVISFVGELDNFTTQLTGLEQATKYYFRTYAITALGIKYAAQKSATTDFIPVENNVITGGATLCEGSDFGMILGSQPQAGQGNFTYQWQRKEKGRSWEDIEEEGNVKDYVVGTLSETTSFRRVVFSLAIRDESNEVEMTVLKSKGGKIEAKTEWISSEEDTLRLKSHKGEILSWQEANQDFNWHTIANSEQDTNLLYNPSLLDSVYLRAVVQLNECPIAYSDTLKINVIQDVSLEEIENGEMYFVYPNPSRGHAHLNNANQDRLTIRIFDSNAREIIMFETADEKLNLPIENLSNGAYILRIENKTTKKIVKDIKLILMK